MLTVEDDPLTVEETVVADSIKNSPTGRRMLKPYPKDNEARTMGFPPTWSTNGSPPGRSQRSLFATRGGTPISRNTLRTRVCKLRP